MKQVNPQNFEYSGIPQIGSVPESTRSPFWSVMVPTYNQVKYLEMTLKSVLEQDPGTKDMQIEIVDDCSTMGEIETVVNKIGKGRVSFYRQPHNVGLSANFTTCVQRARGYWIHILHSDDMVLPGFYSCLREVAEREPTVGAAFCRWIAIDDYGNWISISRLEREFPGVLPNWFERIAVQQLIQAPAIVVKRSVYERLGGFHAKLSHCADWDMWKRIAAYYPFWYEPKPLAGYRVHSESDTSNLAKSGANIAEIRMSIEATQKHMRAKIVEGLSKKAREHYAIVAISTALTFLYKRDWNVAIAYVREGIKCSCSIKVLIRFVYILNRFVAHLFFRIVSIVTGLYCV